MRSARNNISLQGETEIFDYAQVLGYEIVVERESFILLHFLRLNFGWKFGLKFSRWDTHPVDVHQRDSGAKPSKGFKVKPNLNQTVRRFWVWKIQLVESLKSHLLASGEKDDRLGLQMRFDERVEHVELFILSSCEERSWFGCDFVLLEGKQQRALTTSKIV